MPKEKQSDVVDYIMMIKLIVRQEKNRNDIISS